MTNRRRFVQVAGAIGATGLLGTTAVSGRHSRHVRLELEAIQPTSGEPTDPDNDGLYEDVDGDGSLTYNDVVEFFGKFGRTDVQGRTEEFDFNHNGRLEYDDVVALFQDEDIGEFAGRYVWRGVSDPFEGEINPTLSIVTPNTYTIEWTNRTGEPHNFVIVTEDGEEFIATEPMSQRGETQTVTFDAEPLPGVDIYYGEPQADSMRGDIRRGVSDPGQFHGNGTSNNTTSGP